MGISCVSEDFYQEPLSPQNQLEMELRVGLLQSPGFDMMDLIEDKNKVEKLKNYKLKW